jgi:hypothetical protein
MINLSGKILSISIIVLFISVSFTSAIYIDTELVTLEKKNEADCVCKEISKNEIIKIQRFLISYDKNLKTLLTKSNQNSDIREELSDLSKKVSVLSIMLKELKPNNSDDDPPLICIILASIMVNWLTSDVWDLIYSLYEKYGDTFWIYLLVTLDFLFLLPMLPLLFLFILFNCFLYL